MQIAIVAYPLISERDRDWIEGVREAHDPQWNVIAAHFTLVFPAEIAATVVIEYATAVVAYSRQLSFVLTRARAVRDAQKRGGHGFLLPGEGAQEITDLHDRLYSGPLGPHLRNDIPFVPHLTVGAYDDFGECERLAESLNEQQRAVAGKITRVDVIESQADRVATIAVLQLAAS